MKRLLATAALLIGTFAANAQTKATTPETAKLDSLMKLAQQYINAQQPDSLYSLMGQEFKKQISLEQAKQINAQIHDQLGSWKSHELKSVTDGVAKYRAVFTNAPLDVYISRDAEGKIYTFLFQPAKD
ncbi:DUF3887 domain-containing protein [Fibrella sp. WM1]|uniref:DUF3887 domain-containing protein n=1 Tax=Fibrella musci TaxID=3242485 RepID=UPI003521744C